MEDVPPAARMVLSERSESFLICCYLVPPRDDPQLPRGCCVRAVPSPRYIASAMDTAHIREPVQEMGKCAPAHKSLSERSESFVLCCVLGSPRDKGWAGVWDVG